MRVLEPGFRVTAHRHRAPLQEWLVDIAPGRAIPIPMPAGLPVQCAHCWGQKKILEPGPLGLVPVVCPDCVGTGWRA